MTTATDVLHMQWNAARRHPWTVLGILLCVAGVLELAIRHDELPKALAYLGAMLLCAFIIDLFAQWFPTQWEFPVRRPEREAAFVVGIEVLAMVLMILLFVVFRLNTLPVAWKIASIPAMAIIFPIALPVVLLWWKYKPAELGIRFNAMSWVFLPVLLITAGAAYVVAPDEFTLSKILASEGVVGALITGLITAGLSEEFVRMVLHTRVGAYLRNPAVGWFLATLVWAFLHSPNWYAQGGDLYEALMGAVRIVPLGLMWGYITYRTKSLLPATLVHGFNVWGLQNF
jgi:membrane protease YdiL (CAAX protease family)